MTREVGVDRIERLKTVLGQEIEGAEISHRTLGDLKGVEFNVVVGDKKPAVLLISWERFQDEQSQEAQTRTESYVRQAAALLKAEISLLLKSDGTLETID